jgi:hypothetical protein
MLGLFLILLISGFFSYHTLRLVSDIKIIFYCFVCVYAFWYLPVFVSLFLPFDYFFVKNESFPVSLLSLSLINFILYSGALASKKIKSHGIVPNKRTGNKKFFLIYIPLAYLGPVLDIYKKLSRGYSFSLESVGMNRALGIQTYEAGIISYASTIATGFTIFLLFFALEKQGKAIKLKYLYVIPFLLLFLSTLAGGSKAIIFLGILVLLFRLIQLFGNYPKRILVFTVATLLFLSPIFVWQNLARSNIKSLNLGDYAEVVELVNTNLDEHHPLYSLIKNVDPNVYSIVALVYGYLGVQNDMLYVTIVSASPGDIPFGSSSFQILSRAFHSIMDNDLSAQDTYLPIYRFQQKIRDTYGVFPRVWGGFYWPFYIEGGFLYVGLITLVLLLIHRRLLIGFLLKRSDYSFLNLSLLYVSLCLGFMGSPFSVILPIAFASFMRPTANTLVSLIFSTKQHKIKTDNIVQ